MNQDPHNGLRCSQFEALLADALDEAEADLDTGVHQAGGGALAQLPSDVRRAFLAHRQDCAVCGPLFAEAQRGMQLLRSLSELEPPKNLVHNILAATSHVGASAEREAGHEPGWLARTQHWLRPVFSGLLHSRFATSFAMAFFSVSLTLSLAGVNFGEIAKAMAHPSTFRRTVVLQYTQVEAKVMSYYDNMRVVYEWESRVQQLRKAVAPAQNSNTNDGKPDQQNQNRPAPNSRPEQEENYSQESYSDVIAASILQLRGAYL